MSAAAGEATQLVATDRAPLRLVNCRLVAPRAAAAVVCRDPRVLELRDCWFVVDQLAVCVELTEGVPSEVVLTGNSVRTEAAGGAALSLWGAEGRRPARIKIHLAHNTVAAGRLAAFKDLPAGVEVTARDNDFVFREALVSYVGFAGPDGWRRATMWQGRDNRFHGPGEWVRVDGRPAGIRGLLEWRRAVGSPETGSISSGGSPAR